MRLGGHCVLFGPAVKTDTAIVLGKLAFAGAEGCEMGERFFGLDERERLQRELAAQGLCLSGLHCNGLSLADLLHAPHKAREALGKTAGFMARFPCKNVIATGMTGDPMEVLASRTLAQGAADPALHDPANALTIARNLNVIAREIKAETGVQIHYHNHSWEFADGGLLWFALAEEAPEVCFALDTGWAAVSGYDPVALLERYPGRFHYVHLRDYAQPPQPDRQRFGEAQRGFVILGSGKMNYPRLMRGLHAALKEEDWAIVEYEIGSFDENSYLRAISYLRGIRDMLA